MHSPNVSLARLLLAAALTCLIATLSSTQAQDKTRKNPTGQTDDVVRVNTELVQTDVTVLDKQGRFVDGLRREQFELSVEGKPQAISFFEPVIAEKSAADRETAKDDARQPGATIVPSAGGAPERGRIIFFFVDDVHLAPENLIRARKGLLDFIDGDMRQNDQAAIVSTSGQVGFLQQLTDNKAVLREAAARLSNRRNPETYAGKVPISEYDAAQVGEHFNRELFTYLVLATAAEFQSDLVTAARMVENRVHQINAQSRMTTTNTLGALLGLMRSSAPLPGRKIVFFMTDGFVADPRVSNIVEMLKQITKTAAQVGAVVYSIDARGTFANTATDASQNGYPDYTGSVSRNLLGETTATQEPLQILAADTGGRAFLNSNSFQDSFARALDESSSYYLLAWRPVDEGQRSGKSRIVVSVKGRPDLKVRVRRGFIEAPTTPAVKRPAMDNKAAASTAAPDDELRAALGALYPLRGLPLALSVGYINSAKNGPTLLASMQIEAAALRRDSGSEAGKTEVDVLGVAIDDRGALASFKQKLTIDAEAKSTSGQAVVWNQQLPLAPGLYQVRVAVRERTSGRTGSAMQWLEVPDLATGRLSLSSLFLGERRPADATDEKFATAPRTLMVDVDHRLARTSVLRFQTYIYNAAHGPLAPDIDIQTRVLHRDTPVIVLPTARLPTDTTADKTSLPYWAELALDHLTPGRYVLQVTAIDRRTKEAAAQQANFIIE
jgi:VWFA-related protein